MQCPLFLELEPVKIAIDVGGGGMLLVPEDVRSPPIAVTAGQVATCNLLQNVRNVQRLQGRNFRHVSAIPLPQLLYEWRKGKGPLVWADRQKERWIAVLPYGIYKVKILMLPEGAREGLVLEASVRRAARLLGRINGPSYGLKQPAIVLVLEQFVAEAVIGNGQEDLMHEGYLPTGSIGLALQDALTHGGGGVRRPEGTLYTYKISGRVDLVEVWTTITP